MLAFYVSLLALGIVALAYTFGLYTWGNKRWYKSSIGQLLLSLAFAVFLFFVWYLILALWPSIPMPVRTYVRLGLFVIVVLAILLVAFRMTQLRLSARRRHENLRSVETD